MYKKHDCLLCFYMDKAVRELLPAYQDYLDYSRVDVVEEEGKKRFLELSVSLFGSNGVYKNLQIAPVPSLFINGKLFFDTIPSRPQLEEAIREVMSEQLPRKFHEQFKNSGL